MPPATTSTSRRSSAPQDFYVRFSVQVRCSDKLATLSALDEALVFTESCGSFFNPLGTNKNSVKPVH